MSANAVREFQNDNSSQLERLTDALWLWALSYCIGTSLSSLHFLELHFQSFIQISVKTLQSSYSVVLVLKRLHDHGSSYLIGADFPFQRFSPFLSCQEAWQHAGRHDTGEGAETSICGSESSRKSKLDLDPDGLPPWHISSNEVKVTPPNPSPVLSVPVDGIFKYMSLWAGEGGGGGNFLFKTPL